jgi:broad specificity phosphatase PhoE
MIIKLIRHGESLHNTGEVNANQLGDCNVPLSKNGAEQSRNVGRTLGSIFTSSSLLYCSPYLRCRQTLACIIDGAGLTDSATSVYTAPKPLIDPRLREMAFGYGKTQCAVQKEKELRKIHGWFYYRMAGGESPADIYDRICTFLESMWRQALRRKNYRIIIVSHGITIRCFVMRFMHLTPEQYAGLDNNENCDIITIAEKQQLRSCQFTSGKWGVEGLKFRELEN